MADIFPKTLSLNQYDLESAARALAKVIERSAGVMPTVTQKTTKSRDIRAEIKGVKIAFFLEETEQGQPICRSCSVDSPAERFGRLDIPALKGLSMSAARLLIRAIITDIKSELSKVPHVYQAVDAIRDDMYSHGLTVVGTTPARYEPSLAGFFGPPTHRESLHGHSARFTYFYPMTALVGGRLDVYEEVSPEGKQVVCQIIAPNSPWHGRYSRVVRDSMELQHLAEIIKRAADSSPFQDRHLRIMAQKMDYREIPVPGLPVFKHLQGRFFRLWCGIDGEETRIVRKQIRRLAHLAEDHLLVRRGFPLPMSIRRVFDLVHQASGLGPVKMIVHRGEELAVQLLRTTEAGANGCTLWWDKHTSADVGGKIVSNLGALTALLAEPLGAQRDFSSTVRAILTVPPSGFTFSDRGESHSELKILEDILKRNSSAGLQVGSYQPIDYTEALYNIIAGVQVRWASFGNSKSYMIQHSPAQIEGKRVARSGTLVITGPDTLPFTVSTPLHKDSIAKLKTKIDALAQVGGGPGHTYVVRDLSPRATFISGLQLRLSSKFLTTDSEGAGFESLACKVSNTIRETVIQFDGLTAKIRAHGNAQATIALKSGSRPCPRPRGFAAICRWVLSGAMTKVMDLRPDDIKIQLNGSINWSAVSVVCKRLGQYLRQDSYLAQKSEGYQSPLSPSDQEPVFTGLGEGAVVFSGFGWSCRYSLNKGLYTRLRAFAASTTVLTEILEQAPTTASVTRDVANCLSNRWLK